MPKFVFDLVENIALQATMQGGYVPKQEIVRMLGIASAELFNHFLGRSDERKPGPHVGLNTRSTMALSPFMRRQDYSTTPSPPGTLPLSDGQFRLPTGCAYIDYYDMPGAITVAQVEGAALRLRRFDPIAGPTPSYPLVTTVENGEKQIYPADTQRVSVQYYAIPPTPVYAESYDATGLATYDDAASVDVGWGREHHPELVERTLRLLAQATRDGQLAQTANALTQENR